MAKINIVIKVPKDNKKVKSEYQILSRAILLIKGAITKNTTGIITTMRIIIFNHINKFELPPHSKIRLNSSLHELEKYGSIAIDTGSEKKETTIMAA